MKTKLLLLSFVLLYSVAFSQNSSEVIRHDSVGAILTDLKKFIPEYIQIQNIPGVSIALVNDNNIVWADGFGFVNSITKKRVNTNTLFEVASISKVVTAYIALRLVDEGKLSLDRPLISYLSKEWMPYSVYQDSIKLKHVLSHSSGLRKTTREILFKPGSAYYYSANGFNLVKDVMEEVTGEKLEELAQRLVFQPLGMKNSSFARNDKLLPVTANGHLHATVPIVLFGILVLVQYLIITLIGALIIRLSTKSWKLKRIHRIIFIILSVIVITAILFLILGQNSMGEFACIILFAGLLALALFLILFHTGRMIILKTGLKKVYQRIINILWGLLLSGIIILISTRVINLPVPKWPDYKPGSAGTLRTSPSELALFMIELANPRHLKTETSELLRTPQIKLDENLSWGMGPGIFYSPKGYALWQWGQHIDFQSIMIIYPESKSGVVVCTNNDLLNPDVALEIAQRALGENFNTIRKAIHLNYDYSKQ
jgi:CubicO group peptidase (beta-lactamase class C family)